MTTDLPEGAATDEEVARAERETIVGADGIPIRLDRLIARIRRDGERIRLHNEMSELNGKLKTEVSKLRAALEKATPFAEAIVRQGPQSLVRAAKDWLKARGGGDA